MNYRKFGNTDLKVSEVGFGAWGINISDSMRVFFYGDVV